MSYLPTEKKLVLINIPGSHDSAAYNINFFGAKFAKTQDYDIKQQLKIGVRKFDIRVAIRQSFFFQKLSQDVIDNNEDLICVHGICDCYLDNSNTKHLTYKDVLLELRNFLIQNPGETIILVTDSGRGNRYENIKRAIEIADEILENHIILYDRNLTLEEARGKIVCTTFITNEKNSDGKPKYNTSVSDSRGLGEIHNRLGQNYETFKADGNTKVRELQELFGEVQHLDSVEKIFKNNSKKFPLVYSISCTGEKTNKLFYPDPKSQFDIVNKFFMEYELKREYYYGWINIDFVNLNITKKIIETNFKKEKKIVH